MDTAILSQDNSTRPLDLKWRMSSLCEDTVLRTFSDECDLVSDNVRLIFQVVNLVIIVHIVALFGTGTNIINVVCFVKQGVRDPVNIALIGLTMSELLSMVILVWQSISLNPWFYESDISVLSPYSAQLTAGTPHVAFARVTCCITAFITLERCLCVVLPFKVQLIFTAKRVTVIVIIIYIVILTANVAPAYYMARFAMVPHPLKPNSTWLWITVTKDKPVVQKYSIPINNCLIPIGTFTIISLSTVVMAEAMRRTTKWHKISTAPRTYNSIVSRDQSVSKMVVLIAVMFIICYTPQCCMFIIILVVPKFSEQGHYRNLNVVLYSLAHVLVSINASFNIFIYYNISSRYRRAFSQAICFLRLHDLHNKP